MSLWGRLFGPPNRDKFAQMVMAGLKKAGDKRSAAYEKDEFRLRMSGWGKADGFIFLHNVYTQFGAVPRSARKGVLQDFIRSMMSYLKSIPKGYADARTDILPAVRTGSFLDLTRLTVEVEQEGNFPVQCSQMGEHLVAFVAYDLPESIIGVGQEDLDEWGVSFYEAFEAAMQNFRERPLQFTQLKDGLYLFAGQSEYASSVLLLPEFIRQLPVKGHPLAMVPNRRTVLVTGTEDVENLAATAKLAEEGLGQAARMYAIPMRLEGEDWQVWTPAASHPLADTFRRLELMSLEPDYADQKALLDKLHVRKGLDIFVATYSLARQKDTETLFSYCVWAPYGDGLLPKAHRVIFSAEGGVLGAADWDRVTAVCGDLMEPLDLSPVRFRVRQLPTPRQLREMQLRPL